MPANYILLERIELNASAASVVFANIPQTGYTDLKLVISARTTRSETQSDLLISFNGSTSNFTNKYINGVPVASVVASGSFGRYIGLASAGSATASTFGSTEVYIPNYAGSTNKSFSSEGVSETNSNAAQTLLSAGLWSDTSAINSISVASATGGDNLVQYSTFSLYGLAALGTTPVIAPKASGGNVIDYDGTYFYHKFLTSGTFTPNSGISCDVLVVAGGGGGGGENSSNAGAGGGGAGGYRLLTSQSVASGTNYTVTIGSGGAGAAAGENSGTSGSDSVFSSLTSTGGGFGATRNASAGSGGSGGGKGIGSGSVGSGNTPSTSPSQGNNGGSGAGTSSGGGGGGAGATGANAPANQTGGAGGIGVATTMNSGTSTYYAGGGGGGGVTIGAGGNGGGGNGGNNSNGVAGTINTGGGGGGAYDQSSGGRAGGNGGSGIVIVRYLA